MPSEAGARSGTSTRRAATLKARSSTKPPAGRRMSSRMTDCDAAFRSLERTVTPEHGRSLGVPDFQAGADTHRSLGRPFLGPEESRLRFLGGYLTMAPTDHLGESAWSVSLSGHRRRMEAGDRASAKTRHPDCTTTTSA